MRLCFIRSGSSSGGIGVGVKVGWSSCRSGSGGVVIVIGE